MRKALRLMKKLSAKYSEWQWEVRSETCRGVHQRVRSPMRGVDEEVQHRGLREVELMRDVGNDVPRAAMPC